MLEMMQNKRCSHDDQERPADVITKAEWAKLDKAARRAKFAQRSIHVVGGGKTPIMPDFECWNVESLSSYMDIKTEREVIGRSKPPFFDLLFLRERCRCQEAAVGG